MALIPHGRGALWVISSASAFCGILSGQESLVVQSRVVEVEYAINRDAEPLMAVALWYTVDRGKRWERYEVDADRRSPIIFEAPADGLFGLFLVMTNQTGPSSAAPSADTAPHTWVLVDSTPPVVQLHSARKSGIAGRMTVQVRWTAMDALFSARPITIECQTAAQPEWRPLTEEPLTNTGQFDWVVPPTLSGAVSLRIVAQDLGGHRTFSDPQTITIASTESPLSKPVAMPLVRASESTLASPSSASLPIPQTEPALTGSARAKERAGRLYEEGIKDRDQGRYREGIARLREAVQLDPERTDAIMAMGELFSLLGDQEQALRAYDLVLTRQPNMRAALVGSARALTQKKDFVGASERLRTVLRYHPADAEVWMNLGDVAIYRGDETLARDCYLRASRIDPQATEVIENARKRLALMEETVPKATTRR